VASRYSDRDRTLALAGLLQAARLAQSLAWRGQADETAFEASLASLFINDPRTTEEVFGGIAGVRFGLDLVREKFASRGEAEDVELARYALELTQLAGRVRANPQAMAALEAGLERLRGAALAGGEDEEPGAPDEDDEAYEDDQDYEDEGAGNGDEPVPGDDLVQGLAELYSATLSTLPPRILVNGEPVHLHDARTVARIRAVLLAGVRAADLWHQVDGRQWQLVFRRKRFAQLAAELAAQSRLH